ncbi:MAG: TetR/AcrR family transcriptional regulator [Candidatus Promineifilaceae bacterium]|jgi:AcrR family transcriptional regulator
MAEAKKLDKRIIRTRQQLTEAFFEALEEKGFQNMTVQDITDKAGVNRATFYDHYEDKTDLFNSIIDHTFQQKLDNKIPAVAEFNLTNLKVLILAVFEYLGQLHKIASRSGVEHELSVETRIQPKIEALILDWLSKSRSARTKWSSTPEITASVVSWSIFGAGLMWSKEGTRESAEHIADNTLLLIAGGVYGSLID